MLPNIVAMFIQLSIEQIDDTVCLRMQMRNIVKCFNGKMKAAHLVQNDHVEMLSTGPDVIALSNEIGDFSSSEPTCTRAPCSLIFES